MTCRLRARERWPTPRWNCRNWKRGRTASSGLSARQRWYSGWRRWRPLRVSPSRVPVPDVLVTPQNWNTLAKGVTQHVRRGEGEQDGLLLADLLITDAFAIQQVRAGLREVSCGYEADY